MNYGGVTLFLTNSDGDIIVKSAERFWLYTSETNFSEQRKGQQ
jgi:hypothetical protein